MRYADGSTRKIGCYVCIPISPHTTCTTCGTVHDSGMDETVMACPNCNGVAPTIGEVLRARGLVEGTAEWQDAAARILCGDKAWDRLSKLSPDDLARELGRIDRSNS
jgi:predicted RNA-binding Zn-ribbon protein involved in translation (DUF1610 family)